MKKLRVLAMMHKDLVPPDSLAGLSYEQISPVKTEYDVLAALDDLGHESRILGVDEDLGLIRAAIEEFRPHVVFNVLEEFHGVSLYGSLVIGHLELLRTAYTGCNPRGLMLAHDKILTKKILAWHGVRVPAFAVCPRGVRFKRPAHLDFPLLVKSTVEDASLGISQASVVTSDAKLAERCEFMHDVHGTDALVEQYIDGREMYLGMIGNQRVQTFPVWEMTFKKWGPGPRIATAKVKWDPRYQDRKGIKTGPADVTPTEKRTIERICKLAYQNLGLTGYARADLRLTPDGEVYLIEINANPDLAGDEDFARSAQAGGIGYERLIQRILNLGMSYRPAWKVVMEETS